MRTASVAFLAAVLTASLLTPLVRAAALRLGVLDHALTSRKAHGRPIHTGSKRCSGAMPGWRLTSPLITRLVLVPISVHSPPRMVA